LWVRPPGIYYRGKYLKRASLRWALAFLANIRLGWKDMSE